MEEFKKRRAVRMDIRAEWKEQDHPRDEEGKFTSGGGSSGGPSGGDKAEKREEKKAVANSSGKKAVIKKSKSRNHEFDGSEYNGKPMEVKSGKNSNFSPKSDKSRKIDVSDAIGEVEKFKATNGEKGRKENSLTPFIDKDGNLSPERQRVHDAIVQNFFKDKVPANGKPRMTMSGGGPASGKSFIRDGMERELGVDTTITIDPDDIKGMLPGYTDMAIEGTDAAPHYHEESSALAKRIYQYGLDNGVNVVYDGTGDGSVNSVKKKIQAARDAGYSVDGEYVTVDVDGPDGALVRNQKRYERALKKFKEGKADIPPRLPKEEDVRAIHAAVSDIVPQVADMFDNFKLWDNNQPFGEPKTLVATCKRGKGVAVEKGQDDLINRFLKKGKDGYRYIGGKIVK